jgi:putative ABC transport system ATP-binding protein
VYRNFKSGKETIHALSETSLKIYPGDFIAIIGPSGSGKSTLLTIMGGLQSPSGGEVLLNGKRFSSASKKERVSQRMRNIGFILQTSNLIPFLTIEDQFRFVDRVLGRDFQAKKMENLLKRLRIYDLIKQYPSDLSGGELQRAAIARALYPGPSLVLADEPTASLDTEKAFDLVKMLSEETKSLKKATVMVTHDERLIQYCDRIYQIEDGILRDVTKQKKTSK